MRLHKLLFNGLLIAILATGVSAATFAQVTVWGLQPGDSFRVQTVVERQNTVQLDETPESVQKSTDTFTFEYQVIRLLPGGNLSIQVRLTQADRVMDDGLHSATKQQLPSLRKVTVIATVDPDGEFTELSNIEGALNQLLESHQSGRQLIGQSVSQEVFSSWISHPFWLTTPPKAEARWERMHEVSLGLLGHLRTIATCKAGTLGAKFTDVSISGDSRHIPLDEVSLESTPAPLRFTNVQVKMDSFGGKGSVAVAAEPQDPVDAADPEPDLETPEKRPPFEELSLEFSCSGNASLQVGDSKRTFRFRQQQKLTSKLLPGYRIGLRSRYPLFIRP
jgi:hypothetical protein